MRIKLTIVDPTAEVESEYRSLRELLNAAIPASVEVQETTKDAFGKAMTGVDGLQWDISLEYSTAGDPSA